jgi:hypothetical protein
MIKYKCKECGKRFMAYLSDERKYCSRDCMHIAQKKKTTYPTGDKASRWKGGRTNTNGYVKIWIKPKTHQKEHRAIVERFLGRKLDVKEHIHHIDGNPQNNDIGNLQIMSNSEHQKLHRRLRKIHRFNEREI